MPRVSVMMPAYNSGKYIGEAIESILGQTYQDFELIIVDDGSQDNTYQIMTHYQSKSGKIRILQNEVNRGIAYTRNRLLDEAQGEYLAILDSDDIAIPSRLEKQVAFLDSHPKVGLLGGYVEYFYEGSKHTELSKRKTGSEDIACTLLFHNVFGQSTVMLRQEFRELKYNEKFPPAEDYDLWVRLSWLTQTENIPEVLVRYRKHDSNISQLRKTVVQESVIVIYKLQLERLGIKATPSQLQLHRKIANLEPFHDDLQLQEALAWLASILQANQNKGIYPREALQQLIKQYTGHVCSYYYKLGKSLPEIIRLYPDIYHLFSWKEFSKIYLHASIEHYSLLKSLYKLYKTP